MRPRLPITLAATLLVLLPALTGAASAGRIASPVEGGEAFAMDTFTAHADGTRAEDAIDRGERTPVAVTRAVAGKSSVNDRQVVRVEDEPRPRGWGDRVVPAVRLAPPVDVPSNPPEPSGKGRLPAKTLHVPATRETEALGGATQAGPSQPRTLQAPVLQSPPVPPTRASLPATDQSPTVQATWRAPNASSTPANLAFAAAALTSTLLAAAAAAYSRLDRRALCAQETRERILRALKERPGLTPMQLAAVTDVFHTTVRYHLRRLEREQLVAARRQGKTIHFFVPGHATVVTPAAAAATTSPTAQRIVDTVQAQPGLSVSQASQIVGVDRVTVHYHVKKLAAANLVRIERRASGIHFFPASS